MVGNQLRTTRKGIIMIRVPDISPRKSKDTDQFTAYEDKNSSGSHFISSPSGKKQIEAISDGVGATNSNNRTELKDESVNLRESMFRDALIRNIFTTIHERGDDMLNRLANVQDKDIGNMPSDAQLFLKQQKELGQKGLTDDQQRRIFESSFSFYANEFLESIHFLQEKKVFDFYAQVIDKQNMKFLDMALDSKNLFNDRKQTKLRDMCLLNLDSKLIDDDKNSRKEKLDDFSREFYKKILDKRLEVDPGRIQPMIDAPAVRRVMGSDYLNEFSNKATQAIKDDDMREKAKEWVDSRLEAVS